VSRNQPSARAHDAAASPLPRGMLVEIARQRGILLCLDYDGTVSEITPAAANARPVEGIRTSIEGIAGASKQACVAIVSGRRIEEVKRLLGISSGVLFSGVHGLEFTDANGEASFIPEVAECEPELARVRQWLLSNVPDSRGFWIEDKVAAVGLHYRQADASEGAELCGRFSKFVSANAPGLKLVQLKMIAEAMPRCATKARAVELLKARKPRAFATIYCGDDSTDEDAFAALGEDDVSVLIGAPRVTRAVYRLPDPAALAVELSQLAEALSRADGRGNFGAEGGT
jgi:trehalose-phosphatase